LIQLALGVIYFGTIPLELSLPILSILTFGRTPGIYHLHLVTNFAAFLLDWRSRQLALFTGVAYLDLVNFLEANEDIWTVYQPVTIVQPTEAVLLENSR
jgi:hypothetical protein